MACCGSRSSFWGGKTPTLHHHTINMNDKREQLLFGELAMLKIPAQLFSEKAQEGHKEAQEIGSVVGEVEGRGCKWSALNSTPVKFRKHSAFVNVAFGC